MSRLLLLVAFTACGRIGFDPLGDGGGGGGNDAPRRDSSSQIDSAITCNPVAGCPGQSISVDSTSSAGNSTAVTADNGISGTCGGSASPQASFQLTPLSDGTYTITVTSGGFTLIHIKDMCCTGPELVCMPPNTPAVIQRLDSQKAIIFVEGAVGSASIQVQGS